jgi:hypothetical protein
VRQHTAQLEHRADPAPLASEQKQPPRPPPRDRRFGLQQQQQPTLETTSRLALPDNSGDATGMRHRGWSVAKAIAAPCVGGKERDRRQGTRFPRLCRTATPPAEYWCAGEAGQLIDLRFRAFKTCGLLLLPPPIPTPARRSSRGRRAPWRTPADVEVSQPRRSGRGCGSPDASGSASCARSTICGRRLAPWRMSSACTAR